jgi:hypothetical protein
LISPRASHNFVKLTSSLLARPLLNLERRWSWTYCLREAAQMELTTGGIIYRKQKFHPLMSGIAIEHERVISRTKV